MMATYTCWLFAFLTLILHSVSTEDLCRPASVLPRYQPYLSRRVVTQGKSDKGLSLEECSQRCCEEGCTMAYLLGTMCARFFCEIGDADCAWKPSKHHSAFVILPATGDGEFASCFLNTHTGCGVREYCSVSGVCECTKHYWRSPSGLCTSGSDLSTEAAYSTAPPFSDSLPASEVLRTFEHLSTKSHKDEQPASDDTNVASSAEPFTTMVTLTSTKESSSSDDTSRSATSSQHGSTDLAEDTASPSSVSTEMPPTSLQSTIPTTTPLDIKTTPPPSSSKQALTSESQQATPSTSAFESAANEETSVIPPTSQAASPTIAHTLPPVTTPAPKPVRVLHISAGENRKITLPVDEVTVFATFPNNPLAGAKYEYEWTLIAGPDQGQIEHPHAESARLYNLKVGIYRLHVKVLGPDNSIGEDSVNITVLPKPRLNKPPVAVVAPQNVRVRYPQSTVVLDASQSHDEFDTELQYHWVEVLWPLGKHLTDYDDTHHSVLKLKELKVGEYQLKLVVSDSNDAEGSALVNITVLEERDDPPVALAGDPQVIQLPENQVWLNANRSNDDKGIVSYIWKKLKGPAGNDQSGSSSAFLHLSNLHAGDYLYQLTVKDKKDQSAVSTVSVVVKPANEKPPHVEAGNDMQSVARTIDLVGRAWMGDREANGCLGCTYSWKRIQSPAHDKSRISGNQTLKLHVEQMVPGSYVFRLIAKSSQGKSSADDVSLTIQNAAEVNRPPVAHAGSDVTIRLPNHMAMLDGSQSRDEDDEIVQWRWERLSESPAVGDIANGSDHSTHLKLANLVAGQYTFRLTVTDTFGKASSDEAQVLVLPAASSLRERLFEIQIKETASKFTENDKNILVANVAMVLGTSVVSRVHVYAIDSRLGRVSLVLHVVDDTMNWTAEAAVKQLRAMQDSLNLKVKHSTITVERVNTFYCLNNCSNHGTCEPLSKQCICDTLWLQNPFRAHLGERVSNCDWNLLYVAMVNMAMLAAAIGLIVCCYRTYKGCTRKRVVKIRTPKKRGYALLKRAHSDEDTSIAMLPHVGDNGVLRSHSDSEELLFDTSSLLAESAERRNKKTKRANGKLPNGST